MNKQNTQSLNPLKVFLWPPVMAEEIAPIWTGETFKFHSGRTTAILEYTDSESNWNDALVMLVEDEATPATHPIDVASRRLAIRSFKKYLTNKNSILLDIGCSSGFLLKEIIKQLPFYYPIGADYLFSSLQRVAQNIRNVPLLQFDLRNSPLPEGCVDGISCINVLEHIDDDVKAIQEIFRMLKPGGIAHIEVPATPSCYDIYDEHAMHHRRYKLSDLEKKASLAGFSILFKTHLGFFTYPVFYLVKKYNQQFLSASPEQKAKKVEKMLKKTSNSFLLSNFMKLELFLGKVISYPIGIRSIIIVQKPK
jgi:SAM-dependent methyltransferase